MCAVPPFGAEGDKWGENFWRESEREERWRRRRHPPDAEEKEMQSSCDIPPDWSCSLSGVSQCRCLHFDNSVLNCWQDSSHLHRLLLLRFKCRSTVSYLIFLYDHHLITTCRSTLSSLRSALMSLFPHLFMFSFLFTSSTCGVLLVVGLLDGQWSSS